MSNFLPSGCEFGPLFLLIQQSHVPSLFLQDKNDPKAALRLGRDYQLPHADVVTVFEAIARQLGALRRRSRIPHKALVIVGTAAEAERVVSVVNQENVSKVLAFPAIAMLACLGEVLAFHIRIGTNLKPSSYSTI